ncbi:MAG: inositol monophosphatase family protein [Chloroflexota bacterium]|jgi:myo-inositol-1(or 4)-monophosphatase
MHPRRTTEPAALKDFAESVALSAGRLVRKKWSEPREISEKGYRDLVTDADIASQALITRTIRTAFPDHGFLTEEDDPSLPDDGPIIWVIDPVDGTSNYSRQVPTYCVSIGAVIPGQADGNGHRHYQPVAGAIYDPMRDELFSAAAGGPSMLNGRIIAVSQINNMDRAIISMDWSRDFRRRERLLSVLGRVGHQAHTIRATGSASLTLAWVAAGRFDVYFNFGMSPWDVVAAAVIIAQAGGLVTNISGTPWKLDDATCVASNKLLHTTFLTQAELSDQA